MKLFNELEGRLNGQKVIENSVLKCLVPAKKRKKLEMIENSWLICFKGKLFKVVFVRNFLSFLIVNTRAN